MDRIVVIANPVASQFTGGAHRDVMSALSRDHEVEAVWPASAAEATVSAESAVDDGASVVVAMGGDGMVHHVSQGLVGTETTLAIIPVGTTNVVARLLQVPMRPTKATRLIEKAERPASLGVARMRLSRGSTETIHHAMFAAGLGLDAEVVVDADQDPYRKYRFGSVHYAMTALRVGLGRFPARRPSVEITSGSNHALATTLLIQFRRVYTYFGRIPIRIDTEPDPMTVLTMGRLRRRRVPAILVRALAHKDLGAIRDIAVWPRVERLEVVADPPVAAQADGESLGLADGAVVEWVPGALKVIAGW